jgi:hypothetical protein
MKVFTEEPYRSKPEVNTDYDMIRITIHLPMLQWKRGKRRFIELLHKIRMWR